MFTRNNYENPSATLRAMILFSEQDAWVSACNFHAMQLSDSRSLASTIKARIDYVHMIHAEMDVDYIY